MKKNNAEQDLAKEIKEKMIATGYGTALDAGEIEVLVGHLTSHLISQGWVHRDTVRGEIIKRLKPTKEFSVFTSYPKPRTRTFIKIAGLKDILDKVLGKGGGK